MQTINIKMNTPTGLIAVGCVGYLLKDRKDKAPRDARYYHDEKEKVLYLATNRSGRVRLQEDEADEKYVYSYDNFIITDSANVTIKELDKSSTTLLHFPKGEFTVTIKIANLHGTNRIREVQMKSGKETLNKMRL